MTTTATYQCRIGTNQTAKNNDAIFRKSGALAITDCQHKILQQKIRDIDKNIQNIQVYTAYFVGGCFSQKVARPAQRVA